MLQSKPLHLHHLVITGSVVEGVASLREVVQHISRIKNRHQAAVHPGYPKKVVCTLDGKFNFSTFTSATCEVRNDIMVLMNTFKACMEHGYMVITASGDIMYIKKYKVYKEFSFKISPSGM